MDITTHPYYGEVKDLIEQLHARGWYVRAVDDGGESLRQEFKGTEDIISMILSVDDSYIFFYHPNGPNIDSTFWARIVLGNSPGELVNDFSYKFHGDEQTDVEEFFDNFADKWENK